MTLPPIGGGEFWKLVSKPMSSMAERIWTGVTSVGSYEKVPNLFARLTYRKKQKETILTKTTTSVKKVVKLFSNYINGIDSFDFSNGRFDVFNARITRHSFYVYQNVVGVYLVVKTRIETHFLYEVDQIRRREKSFIY